VPVGSTLPETTEPGKEFRCEFEWSAARNRWRLISSSQMVRNVRRIGAFSFKSNSTSSDTNIDLSTLFAADPLQENDFVYVFVASCGTSDRNVAINTAGWTESAEQYQNDVRDVNAALYYKKMASTPDTTVQVDNFGSSSEPLAGIVVAYRDVNTTNQRDVTGTNTGGLNTGDATPPTITPTTVGAKVAVFAAGTVFLTFLANFTPPSDVTGIVVDNQAPSSGTNGIYVGFGDTDWEAGTFTPLLWDGPGSTDDSWAAFAEAVRPA
jgi:hypothetical protein